MRLFPPALVIGDRDGFRRETDIFNRAQLGDGLTNLLGMASQPLVLALDGEWGSGKTTFLKMWAGKLRNDGFPVVYFDAFETDYAEDAFTALASKIIALATEAKRANSGAGSRFIEKAVGAGKVLLRSGAKLGIRAATMGALSDSDFKELASEIGKDSDELIDKYLKDFLTSQREREDALHAFGRALSELPALLADTDESGEVTASRPLIFIIDELDRCRPTFALAVLERMKHFFSVDNVHFVLGTNLSALCNTIVLTYGPETDARTYLQKFVDLTFFLIDDARYPHERTVEKFVSYLTGALQFDKQHNRTVSDCSSLIISVCNARNINLRAIEKIYSYLAVSLAFGPSNSLRLPPILAGLCILKVIDPALFAKAKMETLTYSEVAASLGFEISSVEDEDEDFNARWWRYCIDPTFPESKSNQFKQFMWQYHFDNQANIVSFTANLIDALKIA